MQKVIDYFNVKQGRQGKRNGKFYLTLFLSAFISLVSIFSLINIYVYCAGARYILAQNMLQRSAYNYILVLGARVYADDTPSLILQNRLQAAITAYRYKPVPIIVSGGVRSLYNEPRVMRNYLLQAGIPAKDIIADEQGDNTIKSCLNYRHNYAERTLLLVTSDYHAPRACFLARKLQIAAYAFTSSTANLSPATRIYNFVREFGSRIKAAVNIYLDQRLLN